MAEEKLHDALLKEWQLKKIESLEKQFKECLEEVKRAEQKAQEEVSLYCLFLVHLNNYVTQMKA